MHYAPIKDTIDGEPHEILPFMGSSRLVEPINRRQVEAVFHGHAHVGTLEGKTSAGVKVFNVAKPILMRAGLPGFYIFEVDSGNGSLTDNNNPNNNTMHVEPAE